MFTQFSCHKDGRNMSLWGSHFPYFSPNYNE